MARLICRGGRAVAARLLESLARWPNHRHPATRLTFVGTEFIGGSLADGTYTLTVRADVVHDRWGRELDGDGNGVAGGDHIESFFRLFGDANGDHEVDWQDRELFRSAFKTSAGEAGYVWYFVANKEAPLHLRDSPW